MVKEDKLGSACQAKVLYSSQDRDEAMKEALKRKDRYLEVAYTGKIPKEAAITLNIQIKNG